MSLKTTVVVVFFFWSGAVEKLFKNNVKIMTNHNGNM